MEYQISYQIEFGRKDNMTDLNSVFLIGRLVRDSELKYTNTGLAICKFSVASSSYAGKEKENHTNFIDCTLWGKLGEAISQWLNKGKQVAVSGELRQNRWTQEGQNRSKVEIVASHVQLLSGDSQTSGQRAERPQQGSGKPQQSFQGNGPENFNDDVPWDETF